MENIEHYRNQVCIARTEINKLRQQLSALKQEHQKEIQFVKSCLNDLRCSQCSDKATMLVKDTRETPSSSLPEACISYRPVGVIETTFQNKRAVPRQPSILSKVKGAVVIDLNVFNNPGHALSGLEEFSHMWYDASSHTKKRDRPKMNNPGKYFYLLMASTDGSFFLYCGSTDGAIFSRIIYHFHNLESTNVSAKVSPPRLGGERRGVFSTRSPHRPCPIGLSLVKIHSIEGNKIYFLGVDMVNGTPVLDIKPYIPQYDYPVPSFDDTASSLIRPPTEGLSDAVETMSNLLIDDEDNIDPSLSPRTPNHAGVTSLPIQSRLNSEIHTEYHPSNTTTPVSPSSDSPSSIDALDGAFRPTSLLRRLDTERGAPDGQERFTPPQSAHLINLSQDGVRVAPWISNPPTQTYDVRFTDDALARLNDLIGDRAQAFKTNIESLLSEDPRSHYVRNRYPDHEYSCVLEDMSVSCVFDYNSSVCTIIAVRGAEEMQQS